MNALLTLNWLFMAIFKKSSAIESGFDIVNTLMGFDEADEKMKMLVSRCNDFLTGKFVILNRD